MHRIAFVGTGGTIAALGRDAFDLADYAATGRHLSAEELIAASGLQGVLAQVDPVNFRRLDSTAITPRDWADLAALCIRIAGTGKTDGIVIGHGTASLEETAFLLSLTLSLPVPVVLTAAMRPANGISTDAFANLALALRAAAALKDRHPRVVVALNDEIHCPRRITKTHTLALNALQSPGHGPIGRLVGSRLRLDAGPAPALPRFAAALIGRMPRVDVLYSHIGADGHLVGAALAAGARGIISAGFAPGMATPAETGALAGAVRAGVTVVQAVRSGGGPVAESALHRSASFVAAGELPPAKARILLGLCLAAGLPAEAIRAAFAAFGD